jgi:hypothetical protein
MAEQRLGCGYCRVLWRSGAPGEIRTPDPQIRSLKLRRYGTGARSSAIGNVLRAGLCARLSRRLYDYWGVHLSAERIL